MSADLRRLAFGCVLGSFDGTVVPGWLLDRIRDGLGGVCLFAQNVVDDEQLAAMCATMRSTRADLVIAIDEEGGDVTRLDARTGSDTPAPAAFGAVDDVAATRAAFAALGDRLARIDIDLTLAPCADVNSDPRNPIVGVRAFGSDPQLVARHVVASIGGIHDGGVLACVKHFPGHGDTIADTHHGPARVSGSIDELISRELVSFAAAIDAGVDAILTAHLIADALDGDPVSLSRPWMRYLRDEMGFDGVIVTDALDMGAVAEGRGTAGVADAAVRALAAGADLLCLGADFTEDSIDATVAAIESALVEGRLDRVAVAASGRRVAALHGRRRRSVAFDVAGGEAAAATVARAAIHVDGPAAAGPYVVIECRPPANLPSSNVTWGLLDHLAEMGWPTYAVYRTEAEAIIAGGRARWDVESIETPLLFVIRDADVHPWQSALIAEFAVLRHVGVVVELGWPGAARPLADTSIVTHGASRASTRAAADLIAASCPNTTGTKDT